MMLNIDGNTSNNKKVCLRCGVLIDKTTDSGWEAFVDGITTQPICIWCDEKDAAGGPKAPEDSEEVH